MSQLHSTQLQKVAVLWVTITSFLFAGCVLACAQQPQKVALVIGNGNYQSVVHLTNPTRDADLIASKLSSLGFTLVGGAAENDLSLAGFKSALDEFSNKAASADVAIFYYAGHGLQVNGINYLVPTDSNPVNGLPDVPVQMIDASSVLDELDQANSRLKIMILDACRNNPFASRGLLANGLADMSGGLTGMATPQGTVIWYATQPGKTASDGIGNNGPFALAISHNIDVPGRDIYAVFNKTALEVMKNTNPVQIPWLAATPLDGDYYFKPGADLQLDATATVRAIFNGPADDPTPSDRIRRLFSSGIATPTRSFDLGETYRQVNQKLDQPFGIESWNSLPVAGEYPGKDVRYFWVYLKSLPVVLSAIVPSNLSAGQCVDPQSYITFLFKDDKLFSISIRLFKSQACPSYGWLSSYLFSSDHKSALIHSDQGDTTVKAHETPDYTIIDVERLDNTKLWLD